jgi:hypothetical protein
MVDPVTDQVVVFNGEIYNFGDLRRRLVAEGRNSSPPVTPRPIARATSRWAARPYCGVLACGASIRGCLSAQRVSLCCRSIAGSGAA